MTNRNAGMKTWSSRLSIRTTSCLSPSLRPKFVAATTPPLPPPKTTIRFRPFRVAIRLFILLGGNFIGVQTLAGPDGQALQVSKPLLAPHLLLHAALARQFFSEAGSRMKKPKNKLVREGLDPVHI